MVNKANVEKLIEIVKAEAPDNIQMGTWNCGTAHCLGGLIAMHWPVVNPNLVYSNGIDKSIGYIDHGAQVLGLAWMHADELFSMGDIDTGNWKEFVALVGYTKSTGGAAAYELFDTMEPAVRKAAAINVLEQLRDTGHFSWLEAVKHVRTPVQT